VRFCLVCGALSSLFISTVVCKGQPVSTVFSAGGSSATFNSVQGGLTAWSVDSTVNQLNLQNFWFNVGGNNTSVGSLTFQSATVVQDSPTEKTLTAVYGSTAFNVTLAYNLTDIGNGSGDIGESIVIQNNRASALNISLIQYTDFDLDGTPGGDTAVLSTDSIWGNYVSASQYKGALHAGATVQQSVVTPEADAGEVDGMGGLLGRISSGAYSLSDNSGPATGSDTSWALQWDLTIGGSGTTGISEDNEITGVAVPEPSSLAVLLLGVFGLGLRLRGRHA